MFERRDIALVIAALGGTGCHELLPELDFRLIAENPKLVVGFSDFGSLVSAIHTVTGLTTYYGPVFATFGQPQLPRLTEESFSDAILANQRQVLRLGPSTFYADEAWYEHNRTERLWKPHSGWRVVKPGSATGPLFACCLTVLQLLLGTEWWPDLSGRLLFLESEEEASLKSITRQLHHLAQEGVFDTINGLVYGRLNSRTGVAESSLDRLLAEFTEGSAIPVISGFDLAHTDPLVTLPLGQNTSITTEPLSIHLKEN
jgi:muramoyltetrapeptide carboxypeptidase